MTLEKIGALMASPARESQIVRNGRSRTRESPDGSALAGFWS
jgi:hypothetical protein